MQNFGKIKNTFNNILVESMMTKDADKKALFSKYIKSIKENEVLKTQFLVYNNIETKVEKNELRATEFVKECIALFNDFDKVVIAEANTKLMGLISSEKSVEEYGDSQLHESISKLIFEKKSASNLDSVLEAQSYIVNHIMNNEPKMVSEKIDLPMSMVSSMFVDTYNKKYETLTESDKKVLKVIIDSTDAEKVELYSNIIRECIDLIDAKLVEADLESKDKLLKVKDKLLNDTKEINEDFIGKISKLVDLKSGLIEN